MEYEIIGGYDDNIIIYYYVVKGYIFIFIDNLGNDICFVGIFIIVENNVDIKFQ